MKGWCAAGVIVSVGLLGAQAEEFARIVRNGEHATLSVFGSRPVHLAVNTLVDEFGVAINVEDPLYVYRDDVQLSHVAGSGKRVMVPKPTLLELPLSLTPNGSLEDGEAAVRDLRETANRQLPFAYRVDRDGDVLTLVPTRTRDEHGRLVELPPLLDRRVTVPRGSRTILEHVNVLTASLQRQTGIPVGCCQTAVGGIPWGSTVVSFEARDEPARNVLRRLLRSEPGRDRLVRNDRGAYVLVKSEPAREHWRWALSCQPGDARCFIHVAAVPEKP